MANWFGSRLVLPVLLGAALAACSMPPGGRSTPESVHYAAVHARMAGDVDALWDLFHPEVQSRFDRWLAAEKRAVSQVELLYPDGERESALAALGASERAKLDDGRALFVHLLGSAEAHGLGTWERIGAHVRSITLDDDRATVGTWAGDDVPVWRLDDGQWSLVPTEAELAELDAAMLRAEANLEQVKRNIAALRGDAAPEAEK